MAVQKYSTEQVDGQSWAGSPPDHSSPGERPGTTACDGSTTARFRVMRLSDQDGKPITRCLEDEWAAEHLMALCRGHPGDTRRRHRPRGHDDALAGHPGAESRALAFAPSAWSHRDIPEFESGSLFQGKTRRGSCFFGGLCINFDIDGSFGEWCNIEFTRCAYFFQTS